MDEIFRPILPPRAGYVEVLDEDGNHVYEPTPETASKLQKEADTKASMARMETTISTFLNSPKEEATMAAAEMNRAIQLFASTLTDESTMMEIATIYPEYKVGVAYKTKDIFRYGKNSVGDPQLYQVLQDHTSAEEFPPETSTGLYKKVGISDDGTPMWVQPLGATDAYTLGDIVMHKDKKWKSEVDNNVWEPGVYGWAEVTTDPGEEEIPEWVQPSSAEDAYKKGDVVMYNGKKYQSLIDANTWSPDAYPSGWELIN